MLDKLMLLSGGPIPFVEAQTIINQPSIRNIGRIGEDAFYSGCSLLTFNKNKLTKEDKAHLESLSNFDIIMSVMNDDSIGAKKSRVEAEMVLALMFPQSQISLQKNLITLQDQDKSIHLITNENYNSLVEIMTEMFCLSRVSPEHEGYNPQGELAKKIADKLKRGKQKVQEQSGSKKVSILSRYASIIATGQFIPITQVMDLTVYQLFDAVKRFELWENFDFHMRAKLAGAKDLEEPKNWMKDLYSQDGEDYDDFGSNTIQM